MSEITKKAWKVITIQQEDDMNGWEGIKKGDASGTKENKVHRKKIEIIGCIPNRTFSRAYT